MASPDGSSRPLLLQLFGAPRLIAGAHALRVGSRKALAILAILALDGSGTRQGLSALLWPELEAAAGRRNLRRELFRLRELGVDITEDADGGLSPGADLAVDALQLVREERLPEAAGLPLDGLEGVGSVEFDGWLQRRRSELAQRRVELLARQAAAREARGDLAGALALQAGRWAADACDETAALAVARLRVALGDRVGALQALQALTAALRDELDVAPSAAVEALAASLRGAAGSESAAAVAALDADVPGGPVAAGRGAATVPSASLADALPDVVPFVRRAAAQQRIEAAWARGQRVYLHGPAGTGKTRLACELAAGRGPWLRVACEPQDAELPYSSVVRLLRALRESAPGVALPEWVGRELAQLMPELGEAPRALATDEARQRLLSAVAEAWRLLMHDNFSAFVLDDWHWGDSASVELWARLDATAPAAAPSVAWIVSYRSAQLPAAALERQRADIDSRRGVAVALEGFAEAEVLALTQALSGSPGGKLFSQRLHGATEGNPFFLLETLRHLFERGLLIAESGGWSTPFDDATRDYAELPVPESVRAAVLARVRALGAAVQRLLEAASLVGGEIDAALLTAVAGLDEDTAVTALEHAAAAQLVRETATGWRFAHDLVRQSMVNGMSSGRRRLLHERLAARLESERAEPALIAGHWEAAQRPNAAVRWRVAAAEAAARVHALSEALGNYAQALADGAEGAAASAIHLACAHVHMRRVERADADASFEAAVRAAASDAGADSAAVLRARLAQAEHLCVTERIDAGLAALDVLAPELDRAAPAVRAKGLAVRGTGLSRQGHYAAAEAAMGEAEALLEPLPDARPQLAALLVQLARSNQWRGNSEGWGRYSRRAVVLHELLDDPAGLAVSLSSLFTFLNALGQKAEALAVGERARSIAARCRHVPVQRDVNFNLVRMHLDGGDTDRVLELLDESEALAPAFENRALEQNHLAARCYVHQMRAEVPQARAAAERLLRASAGECSNPMQRVGFLKTVAEMHLLVGDLAAARALLDEALALCDAQRARGDDSWFGDDVAQYRAWLALAEGRPADALAVLPDKELVEIGVRFHQAWIGAAAALALGDLADARRRLDAVGIDETPPADALAFFLEQRLLLATREGRVDAAAAARAEALLAERRVPLLLVPQLRRALDAAPS